MDGITFNTVIARNVNFSGIDFSKPFISDLNGGRFKDSNFENSVFSGVNLSGSRFDNVNLSNTDFSNSNLTGVNFRGSNLNNANFTGAKLTGTKFDKDHFSNKTITFIDNCDEFIEKSSLCTMAQYVTMTTRAVQTSVKK